MCSIKFAFFFFNSLFLASGVALMVIGVMSRPTYSDIGAFIGSGLSQAAVLLIAVGVVIAVVSLLGFFGAFLNMASLLAAMCYDVMLLKVVGGHQQQGHDCCLTLLILSPHPQFICIVILIIALEVITGIALYVFRSKAAALQMNSAINNKAREVISEYSLENRRSIHNVQHEVTVVLCVVYLPFKCCGADGFADWHDSAGWGKSDAVPDSCCMVESEGCGQDTATSNIHTKGCIWAVKLFLMKNLVWVAAVCIALGITEVFGVLLGTCLCLDIKRGNYQNFK
ncbi:CD63 antigen-like [Diretmus argenteus]